MMSNVKGVSLPAAGDMRDIQKTIDKGNLFTRLDFKNDKVKPNFSIYAQIKAMAERTQTGDQAIANIDAQPYADGGKDEASAPEYLAQAAQDFTILETSFFFADMYRDRMDAEIGLIANNASFRGNVMRIFAGGLTSSAVNVLKPRSFDNGSALIKAVMTGRQLLDALNAPAGPNDTVMDCVYAFSGLKCRVAPWNPLGSRYLSVALTDGSPVDENREYTVAMWEGTVAPQFITRVEQTCEGTFEELLTQRLEEQKTITPPDDGRITLVWSVK